MGKRGTALLVAAVAGLGVAAGIDALRGGGDPVEGSGASRSGKPTTASAAQKLASRQITGVLYFTVRVRPGQCALRSLVLPTLEAATAVDVGSCRIATSPGGRVAAGGPCPASSISVLSETQPVSLEGCAPAWKPDGTLTFVQQGRVVELANPCTRPDPADCLRRTRLRTPSGEAIRELAWIGDARVAVLTDGPGRLGSVFVYEAGLRLGGPGLSFPQLSYLRPFGRGRAIVRAGQPPGEGFLTIDERGRSNQFFDPVARFLADGQALTVSPDGTWVASTKAGVVLVYRLGDRRPLDPIRFAIDAVDLGWGTS